MTPAFPLVKELVFIGGGHTHALVLRNWGMAPVPGVRVTLINPGPTAPYSGMLPGHIAGHYTREALEIDLVRLARFADARLILGAVDRIDPEARQVHVPGRPPIAYDRLSVDIGITAEMAALPGFATHGIPAKPLAPFAERWAAFCEGTGQARIAVIGGGVAGVELALACAHRLRQAGRTAEVTVIDKGAVLDGVAPAAKARLLAAMEAQGITRKAHTAIRDVTAEAVRFENGETLPSDFTIGAAGAVPHAWLAGCGMVMEGGYMAVDAQLRSVSHPEIYGAGDCVHLSHAPRPKAGVYAVRAAPVLSWNLRADLTGRQRRVFKPQRDFLKLISLGETSALAEKAGLALSGPAMWRWKDRIDQRFMARFRDLPDMDQPVIPKERAKGLASALSNPPPCGGCGAKLGADALRPVLGQVPWDDAAVITLGGVKQVISTDHMRGFSHDPVLVARAAAIHALGDIWAMGAVPQAALASVILPRMSPRLQQIWLTEIMAAVRATMAAEEVEVIGGHSSMGAELTIGFTLTGQVQGTAVTLAGATPGDALILSRALGTGTVLAGEMRGKARGADVATAWGQIVTPQGKAAGILAREARAMTDVTGFGLAGHLGNICSASGVGAEISLSALPLLPGALSLAEAGIRSSLFAQNRDALTGRIVAPETARAALIHDPQTSGGFLAAVPAGKANGLVTQLRDGGFDAARIGEVTDTNGQMVFT